MLDGRVFLKNLLYKQGLLTYKIEQELIRREMVVSLKRKDSISYLCPKQNKRYICKTGRFIKKIVPSIKGRVLELMAAEFNKEFFHFDSKVELLKGEDILCAYMDSWGGGSCMTGGNERTNYMRIYSDNPDYCQLAIATITKPDGAVNRARAFYWRAFWSDGNKEFRYGDRIYHQGELTRGVMLDWQKDNCDVYYAENSLPNMYVPFAKIPEEWPFTDSFLYINPSTLRMESYSTRHNYMADSTEGMLDGYEVDGRIRCYNCSTLCWEDDTTELNNHKYCTDCFEELHTECYYCSKEGMRNFMYIFHKDGKIKHACCDCQLEHVRSCDWCNHWQEKERLIHWSDTTFCPCCIERQVSSRLDIRSREQQVKKGNIVTNVEAAPALPPIPSPPIFSYAERWVLNPYCVNQEISLETLRNGIRAAVVNEDRVPEDTND